MKMVCTLLHKKTYLSQFECIGIALVKAVLEWSSMFGHVISVEYIVLVTSGMAIAVLASSYLSVIVQCGQITRSRKVWYFKDLW